MVETRVNAMEKDRDRTRDEITADILNEKRPDPMQYMEGMEQISSDIFDKVMTMREEYDEKAFTKEQVIRALRSERKTPEDFMALLSKAAEPFLEEMAELATKQTRKQFGNSVYMFTPLYLANYCENYCVYCGFNCHNKIKRARLDKDDMEKEMKAIADTGLEEILLLTGESRSMSDVTYIGEACKIARNYFKMVGLEVYPMNSDEYAYLKTCGAD